MNADTDPAFILPARALQAAATHLLTQQSKQAARAEVLLRRVLEVDQNDVPAWELLQRSLRLQWRFADALEAAECGLAAALLLEPARSDWVAVLHLARAQLLADLGQPAAGLVAARTALLLEPDNRDIQLHLAQAMLLGGDWPGGFDLYRASRTSQAGLLHIDAPPPWPMWHGETPVASDALLVVADDCISDTLQFARDLLELRARFARVTLLCQPAAQRILQQSLGACIEFIVAVPDLVRERQAPSWQWRVPLLSVPAILAYAPQTLPQSVPYLFAEATGVRAWGERFAQWEAAHGGRKLRVGLAWCGQLQPDALEMACRRDAALHLFSPLLARDDVQWVSLQNGSAQLLEVAALDQTFQPLSWIDECKDIAEMSTLVANLDLIISVDAEVAHLAGAMGRPVWLLNRFESEWRWLWRHQDTPWYPTMRIFNQTHFGDWVEVLKHVDLALDTLFAGRAETDEANALRALQAALTQRAAGRLTQAEEACRLALTLAPDLGTAYEHLGRVLCDQGRGAEAQPAYRQALCLQPGMTAAARGLAQLLLERGQFAAAEVYARQALQCVPQAQYGFVAENIVPNPQRRLTGSTTSASLRDCGGPAIEFVCATRLSRQEFWLHSPLGVSLQRLRGSGRLAPTIVFENARGLAEVYDARLRAPDSAELLAFVHDDVWIDDLFAAERLVQALQVYAVVGVAGNRRSSPDHVSWAFANEALEREQSAFLSGHIAHGNGPLGPIRHFGSAPADCELLDGVLLAVRKSALRAAKVSFDRRFAFHFHDLDLCRAARAAGLRIGTWPITLTHRSEGAGMGTPAWREGLRLYRQKYGYAAASKIAQ